MAALDAVAVTSEIVVSARSANQPARRVCLQPSFTFTAVPDAILRTEHPSPAFAVEDREVANGEPECSGVKPAVAALLHQQLIVSLGVRKRIDSHAQSIALASPPCGEVDAGRKAAAVGWGGAGAQFGGV